MLIDILRNTALQPSISGDEAICLCPFCEKRKLSINLGTKQGAVHCWGCDLGGVKGLYGLLKHLGEPQDVLVLLKDLSRFVKEVDNTEHAVLWDGDTRLEYKDQWGKWVPEDDRGSYKGHFEGAYLVDRQPAVDYMLKNGFDMVTIEQAPVGWDQELQRVVFFCYNHLAELCLIDGRSLLPETLDNPRYKVYTYFKYAMPDYRAEKSKLLYQLHTFYADRVLYKNTDNAYKEPIIICEGYKATLWVKQCLRLAGREDHVVGLMGSSISDRQVLLIEQCSPEQVVLFLDQDPAGIRGTDKAIGKLSNLNTWCAKYPRDCSPDDLTPEEVLNSVDQAVCPVEWYWEVFNQ